MKASIEIDLLVHLGKFLNIDLLQRGIYSIEITLFYGNDRKRISPVGLFSSPSNLDSHVGDVLIPGEGMLKTCEVDEEKQMFRTRTIAIRYKGEKHELNEGVQFRFTIPDLNIEKEAPVCPDLLFVQFGLIHQELPEERQESGQKDPDIPRVVSVQTLGLQSVSSGFNHYFPVSFDGNYCVNLDVMIHAMVTGIHYYKPILAIAKVLKIEPQPYHSKVTTLSKAESIHSNEAINNNNNLPKIISPAPRTGGGKRVSTTIQENTVKEETSFFSSVTRFARKASRIITKKPYDDDSAITHHQHHSTMGTESSMSMPSSSATISGPIGLIDPRGGPTTVGDGYDDDYLYETISIESITEKEWKEIISDLFTAVIKNYEIAINTSNFILHLYEEYQDSTEITIGNRLEKLNHPLGTTSTGGTIGLASKEITICKNKLSELFHGIQDILSKQQPILTNQEYLHEIISYFFKEIDIMNLQLSIQWSLIFTSCRKIMKLIKKILYEQYSNEIQAFWKQQMIIHTRSFTGSEKLLSKKDVITLSTLEDQIDIEKENDKRMSHILSKGNNLFANDPNGINNSNNNSNTMTISSRGDRSGNYNNLSYYPKILARGLKVFDVNVHMFPSRTAYMFMEKYMTENNQIDRTLNNLENLLLEEEYHPHQQSQHQQHDQSQNQDHLPPINQPSSSQSLSASSPFHNHHKPQSQQQPQQQPQQQQHHSQKPELFYGKHLVILSHGFLGNSFDMRLFVQAIRLLCPKNTIILNAVSNEHSSQSTISMMGKNLRNEIIKVLTEKHPEFLDPSVGKEKLRVSFIAHSMGGLIIRSALQEKELASCLLNKLHLFISLAVPHLGTLFPDSNLVSTGMWALSKFKNCVSLKELVFDDLPVTSTSSSSTSSSSSGNSERRGSAATPTSPSKTSHSSNNAEPDLHSAFLYQLSEKSCLSRFTKIVLVSSPKDQYVPFHSARLQITPKIESSPKSRLINQIIDNLFQSLSSEQLIRITLVNNTNYNIYEMQNAITHYQLVHDPVNVFNSLNNNNNGSSNINNPNDMGNSSTSPFDINNMIGRTAHICYVENPAIAFQIIYSLIQYFIYDYYPH